MGNQTHKYNPIKCKPSCCTSKSSTFSSSTSSSSPETANFSSSSFSNLIHAMVQSRLERMINNESHRASVTHNNHYHHRQQRRSNNLIVLLAMGKSSSNPREDFRDSIIDVVTMKGMREPKELRCLLDCYISLNSPEHRQVILEAFLEVCSSLFGENSI